MKKIKILILGITAISFSSCSDYLDIVPDNVATLDYAFRMRSTAEKYLFTCYSFLPNLGSRNANPGFMGADEVWVDDSYSFRSLNIAKGQQNTNDPILDYWNGSSQAKDYWVAISQCNIFLENINAVPDMEEWEKEQWTAEVKFLKAYYHFFMLRHYGPIPIMRENLPISASGEEVRVKRQPVDEVFDYIIELMDEAIATPLPDRVLDETTQLGRITQPIVLGMKAKILTYAASPLFNGNQDYAGFTNSDGTPLFNTKYEPEKWEKAVVALKEAIDYAHSLGYGLYEFEGSQWTQDAPPEILTQLTFRNKNTERWNKEIIWANTGNTTSSIQEWMMPKALTESQRSWSGANGVLGATINQASRFYSDNGVPIDEDKEWDFNNRYELREGTAEEKYHIKEGYTTVEFNFDREPRYYASFGFDGGIWYGNGNYNAEDPYWLEMKRGQFLGKYQQGWHAATGIHIKKLVYYTNTATNSTSYNVTSYPWVMLRLGDLYLLYAEALNEAYGPTAEVFEYLDAIREKAGLAGVQESWSKFSNNPSKPDSKSGLRKIIQQERTIEMSFEGQRFYDVRRWKTAPSELNQAILGWDVNQETNQAYYRPRVMFQQTFSLKDYFWPLRERDLIVNKNLVQNLGW